MTKRRTVAWAFGITILFFLPLVAARPLLPPDLADGVAATRVSSNPALTPAAFPGVGAATPAALDQSSPDPFDDPFYRFLTRLGTDPTQLDDREFLDLVQDFYHEMGYQIPPSDAGADAINASYTMSFTHPVGDVDGDGREDIAFDVRCVAWDECTAPLGLDNLQFRWCGLPHWIEVRSGLNGEVLWKQPLDQPPYIVPELGAADPGKLLGCGRDIVIGTVEAADGTKDILMYRIESIWLLLHHDIYLLKAAGDGQGKGKALWHREYDGVILGIRNENILTMPMLQKPTEAGARVSPVGTQTDLWVRGITFTRFGLCECILTGTIIITEYQPDEWAARLDLATGEELWNKKTFTPKTDLSVFPISYPNFISWWNGWIDPGCCWDLTGDKLPDLVFTTYEWSPIPLLIDQPYGIASHTVVFDVKSGDKVYEVLTEPGTLVARYHRFRTWLTALGDADGDGVSDFIQQAEYLNFTEDGHLKDRHIFLDVRHGQDGQRIWRMHSDKRLDPLVLGGDGIDGSNDFLLAFYSLGRDIADGLTNVTDTEMQIIDSRDGSMSWATKTFTAPLDIYFMFANSRRNGLIDLDNDDVGDVWTDQPEQKDDLTLIHHTQFLAGQDGHALLEVTSVGAYAFPIRAGDLDGDGGNDFTITQGDTVDLWITAYNGQVGNPLWSRRMLEVPVSGSILSIPLLHYHTIELDLNTTKQDLLLSFNLYVFTAGGGRGTSSFYQQHQALQGFVGPLLWAVPELPEGDESLWICAPTPATSLYTGLKGCDLSPPQPSGGFMGTATLPVAMTLSGGASLAVAFLALRRRWMS